MTEEQIVVSYKDKANPDETLATESLLTSDYMAASPYKEASVLSLFLKWKWWYKSIIYGHLASCMHPCPQINVLSEDELFVSYKDPAKDDEWLEGVEMVLFLVNFLEAQAEHAKANGTTSSPAPSGEDVSNTEDPGATLSPYSQAKYFL